MKKVLLTILAGGAMLGATAKPLIPTPEYVEEKISDGKVDISWKVTGNDFQDASKVTGYHVIIFKKHKATAAEDFVLAQTDFSYIESKGTMKKHEERGAIFDYVPTMPGWYVKSPQYMNKAIGIDTFMYFTGSDNDDAFGGAYMLSPDYDMANVATPKLNVECELGNEATSVTGGFALYTYNLDWWDERNVDYKYVEGHDHHFEDLHSEGWVTHSESCEPDEYSDRTRVCFYGRGYSAMWVNSLKVTAPLVADDEIGYAAEVHVVDGTSFTIDTSADTANDYVYGYQVRAVWMEDDDYRKLTTMRSLSDHAAIKEIGKEYSGIEDVVAGDDATVAVSAANGVINVIGADRAEVYAVNGQLIYSGNTATPIAVGTPGVYVVRAGGKVQKVVL